MLRACTRRLTLGTSVDLESINQRCHAFLLADVVTLVRRVIENLATAPLPAVAEQVHFLAALEGFRVGAVRGNTAVRQIEKVAWTDIGGLDRAKEQLEETVIWAFRHSAAFLRLGVRPSKGALLYGPPGTGKTMLAKAVATASSANFIPVSIPDLLKGEVGETEKAIQRTFETASLAAPCVIFLDEIEALFASRGEGSSRLEQKMVSQLLLELDSLDLRRPPANQVAVLAATNVPWIIDPAALRPGRLDTQIYVPPPDEASRVKILELATAGTPLDQDVDLADLAKLAPDFTGADLKNLCRNAALRCLERQLLVSNGVGEETRARVRQADFVEALKKTPPSLLPHMFLKYQMAFS